MQLPGVKVCKRRKAGKRGNRQKEYFCASCTIYNPNCPHQAEPQAFRTTFSNVVAKRQSSSVLSPGGSTGTGTSTSRGRSSLRNRGAIPLQRTSGLDERPMQCHQCGVMPILDIPALQIVLFRYRGTNLRGEAAGGYRGYLEDCCLDSTAVQ